MWRRLLWACLLLSLVSCQPYLDHEEGGFNTFGAELPDFGPKRQLELKRIEGDQRSLLFVFNQPLRRPEDTGQPPFVPTFNPPVTVAQAGYEGVAGVRLTFAEPLPAATEYKLHLPAGWRAATGVRLPRHIERRWTTPRPALQEIGIEGESTPAPSGEPLVLPAGRGLELVFNQPVALGSVRNALRWTTLDGGKQGEWTLEAQPDQFGVDDHTRLLFRPTLTDKGTYRLALGPGIKGLQGPLRGQQIRDFLVRGAVPLLYLGQRRIASDPSGQVVLPWSAPLKPAELARCLVTVPLGARPSIAPDPDGPSRLRLTWVGQPARRLILLAGLTAVDGQRLSEDVNIELQRASEAAAVELGMVPISLGAGRSLPGASGKTASWILSLEQALAVSQLAQATWDGSQALSWERAKPDFQAPAGAPQWPVLPKGKRASGFLLVRRTAADGTVRRALASGSELALQTVSTESALQIRVTTLASGQPAAGCELWLRRLESLSQSPVVRTDANGEASLPWPRDPGTPLFLVARHGQSTTFTPVRTPPPPAAPLPAAFLLIDPPFCAPGQPVQVRGFRWTKRALSSLGASRQEEPVTARLRLRDEQNVLHESSELQLDSDGFLQGQFLAPDRPGLYRAGLSLPDGGLSEVYFRVCPEAAERETYSLSVEQSENGLSVVLERGGALHRQAGLRAFLLPPAALRQEQQGWTAVSDQLPARQAIPVKPGAKEGEFDIRLVGDTSLGGTLLVEAYDLKQPELVLCRTSQPVEPTVPYLEFELAQSTPGSVHQAVSPSVVGWDGDPPHISGELLLRTPGSSEWKESDARAVLVGPSVNEPWSPRLHQPGEYRLILRALLPNGPELEAVWEKELTATELGHEGLAVEPKLAFPGDSLVATLSAADQQDDVWLDCAAAGLSLGGWRSFRDEGRLQPITIPFVRDDHWTLSTRSQTLPSWGAQRARWIERSTPVPLAPISREARLSLSLERSDGLKTDARAGENLRVRVEKMGEGVGWKGVLGWRPALPEWELPEPALLDSFLGQPALPLGLEEGYPLLPAGGYQVDSLTGWSLDEVAELTLAAPDQAGAYRWWAIARDSVGRFGSAQVVLELADVSRWSATVPWGVRPGDEFEAGIKFVSGPAETGPIGLTATAVGGENLSPSGYVRTAGVAKPGATNVLQFDYEAPEDAKGPLSLAWDLGHQGALHTQQAKVQVFETPSVPRGLGLAVLQPGVQRRIPVQGNLPWRLVLHPPGAGQETLLSLYGPAGSLGKVHLRPGAEAVTLQGAGPGTVGISSLAGPAVSYEMFRLSPDDGTIAAWGSRVYLFRGLTDLSGEPVTRPKAGERYRVVLDLVNPAPLGHLQLRVPLPGGTRPVALKGGPGGGATDWKEDAGAVVFEVSDLQPGEFLWELEVEAVAAGDYLWPTAQAVTPDGAVQALSGSGILTVE